MALTDILDAIAAEADREVAALREQADREVAAIRARADADVAALDRQCEERRRRYMAGVVARIAHSARLDAIRRIRSAREDVAATVMAQVGAELGRLRERPDHGVVFARWVAELRAALPEGERLKVNPADEALARATAPDLAVVTDPSVVAGAVLEAPDGRTAIATPPVRTDRAGPAIRRAIAQATR